MGEDGCICFLLSIDAARRVDVVPWHIALDEQVRVRLVQFLEEESKPKPLKRKRTVSDVSPDESKRLPLSQPSVSIQSQQNIQSPQNKAEPPVIYYVLDGRAGTMVLPFNDLILVRKLREKLLPCTNEDEN